MALRLSPAGVGTGLNIGGTVTGESLYSTGESLHSTCE
jgi:hypothetical protein